MKHLSSIFKPAKSENRIWNLFKTLLHTIVFWLVFLLFIPQGIILLEKMLDIAGFPSQKLLGWLLFCLFSCLGLYSGYTMSWLGKGTPLPLDCANHLVVKGPYKFVRNPMAVAGIGQGISIGITLGSYWVIAYALIGAFLWHILVRPSEEKDLENRFGNSFLEYKKRIKCWIPRFF